jgi:type IV pilus assembly protein PilC
MWWEAEMARYAYVATAPDGRLVKGTHQADGREAVELALYARALRDIKLTEKASLMSLEITPQRVKREDIMHLSRQLGAFIRAGLPLIDAISTLGEEATNPSVRRMMRDVTAGLRGGDTLSDCLDRHPTIFPEFYRGILRSAELTGQLDTVLDQLARYLERDLEARRKVKSALLYPTIIAAMSLVTVVVLGWFVLPKFKDFFSSLHAKLPLPTRMLLAITDFFAAWWWAVGIGAIVVTATVAAVLSTRWGRHGLDRLVLTVPVLGTTIQFALVERFCRILASMTAAGVSLPEALRVATGSIRNSVFVRSLSHVSESVLSGEGLAGPLGATKLFPPTAVRMMRVGEDTGTLDTQLEVTARYYEGELDYKLKKLTALFEPAVIIVMGGIVGFVALALVEAMYGIFNQVQV